MVSRFETGERDSGVSFFNIDRGAKITQKGYIGEKVNIDIGEAFIYGDMGCGSHNRRGVLLSSKDQKETSYKLDRDYPDFNFVLETKVRGDLYVGVAALNGSFFQTKLENLDEEPEKRFGYNWREVGGTEEDLTVFCTFRSAVST